MDGHKKFYYKAKSLLLVAIFALLIPSQATGQETPELIISTPSFSIPVVLNEEKIIEGFYIDIAGYDPAVIEETEATLTGGILENKDYVLFESKTDKILNIASYALGTLVTGKGYLAFINFDVKGQGNVTLSITKYDCNDLPGSGGFDINGIVSQDVEIVINFAPVLDDTQSPALTTIDEDNFDSGGNTIAEIVVDGSITDADEPIEAIAVTAVDNINGNWQYSLDNGVTWINFSEAAGSIVDISTEARLLDGSFTGDETNKIRFVPNAGWSGTPDFTFRAWDKTSGEAGQTADASAGGDISPFSLATDNAVIEITGINDAPVLDNTKLHALAAIDEDTLYISGDSSGNSISEIIADDSVTDQDGPPAEAMAVTGVNNTNGSWEYSIDNSVSWTGFTAESGIADISAQARLLDETHRIRFVPNADWNGTSTFSFRAWDKSSGTTGQTGDASIGGHDLAFSETEAAASITVNAINDAPVLDNTQSPALTSADEDDTDNNGDMVGGIITDNSITDADGAIKAIAVTIVNNINGIWQFSTDSGATWVNFSDLTGAKDYFTGEARLLDTTQRIRFVPNPDWHGTTNITFRAWDKSSGTPGETANASTGGGTSAFSQVTDKADIEVKPVNDAPVLDDTASPSLTAIDEDDISDGNSVGEIVVSGSVTDRDGFPTESVAVTGIDNTNGKWQFSTDNGATWKDFSTETGANTDISGAAVLLDEDSRIRFMPADGWNGASAFTFRAWDMSIGEPGETADAGEGGGTSPFSSAADDAVIEVNALNDAPVLDDTATHVLTPVDEDDADNNGNTVAEIVADESISDIDSSPAEAVAVIKVDNTNGKWQFSVDGSTWADFTGEAGLYADISDKAVLLDDTCRIRFMPDPDWNGTATFIFRAWDMSSGVAGETANASEGGGMSAFSEASDDAGIEVSPVNDAPVLDNTASPELSAITSDDFESSGNTVDEIVVDNSITDPDGSPVKAIAVISVDNTNGKWQFSTDSGVSWTDFSAETGIVDITSNARVLSDIHKIRFVPGKGWIGESAFTFHAWDKTDGTPGQTADAGETGGASAFSSDPDDAVIIVEAGNYAPELDATQSPMLSAISMDDFDSSGNSVAEIVVDGSVSDADGEPVEAIAVTGVDNSNGTWQFSTDNRTTWNDFSTETGREIDMTENSRFLDGTSIIRFVPVSGWEGTATFSFRAWDKSSGETGDTSDTSDPGGVSAFSLDTDEAEIEVNTEAAINDAPVLDATYSPTLTAIYENNSDSNGDSIAEIVVDGSVTDADGLAIEAIAVISLDNTNGLWQYSLDNGSAWTEFTSETGKTVDISAQARLLDDTLTGDETHRIRFVPDTGWNGTAVFSFRAWDKSTGTAGETADTSETGGMSAFSSDADDAEIEVMETNHAPVLDNSYTPVLTATGMDVFDSPGNTVAEIVADGSISDEDGDPDGDPGEAIAVTAVDNTNGVWEYSLDNGSEWTEFTGTTGEKVDMPEEARLLDETHKIRFVPAQGWEGTATFTFRAWDKTAGTSGETADTSDAGGISPFSLDDDVASVEVSTEAAINDAPVLDASQSPVLDMIEMNNFDSSGNSISEIVVNDSVTDADGPALEALAVVKVDNTSGIWQYSTDNGAGWNDISSETSDIIDISGEALLLDGTFAGDETHRIRFVPAPDWEGSATFTFRAWDKSAGTAGQTADVSEVGGTSAFSSAHDEAVIEVTGEPAENHAPVLDPSRSPALDPIEQDESDSSGNSIAEIITDGSIADEDGPAFEAMAVTVADNTNGIWQYSADNGAVWTDFTGETGVIADISAQAVLLDGTLTGNETQRIRFVPAQAWSGTATFTFRAWDKSSGAPGETADATQGGGSSPFSSDSDDAGITVERINHAPVLDNTQSPVLTSISTDSTDITGNTVSEIVADGSVTDPDGTAPEAVAVTAVDNTNGIWQYSTDEGSTWKDFSEITGSEADISGSARLLAESHRIKFVPGSGWFGTASFTFRAWDKTGGQAGETADASQGGGISAFSSASDEAVINVTEETVQNHAPVLDTDKSPMLSPIDEGMTDSVENSIPEIVITGSVTDPDGPSFKAVAVTVVDNTNGTWQYSTDNGATWKNFSPDSGNIDISPLAILLDGTLAGNLTHKIRFVPDKGWHGSASFTFRAWDKTAGKAGQTAEATQGGGTSPFSSGSDQASIQVNNVNYAPVLDSSRFPDLTSITENTFDSKGNNVSEIVVDGSVTDSDGSPSESIAVTGVDNTNGKWQYSLDNGVTWTGFSSETGKIDISDQAVLMDESCKIRLVPNSSWSGISSFTFRAWDKTSGTSGQTADASTGGDRSCFSLASDEATILVIKKPVANAGQDQAVGEGEMVKLDGSESSGEISVYKWSQASGKAVTLSDQMGINPVFTAPLVETGSISLSFVLVVQDNNGLESEDTVEITVSDIPAPHASFEAEPVTGNVPLDVTFKDTSQGKVTEWQWDFGDGYKSTLSNPLHSFDKAGSYTVTLTVKGPGGESTEKSGDYIIVANVPLKAAFEPVRETPMSISFRQSSEGEITEWLWDFGDGMTNTSPDPVHIYDKPGTYTITLTITGPGGTVTETVNFTVTERQISGRVTGADTGEGLENYLVEAWEGNVFQNSVSTDQDGYYTIKELPAAGNIAVAVRPPPETSDYYFQFYKEKQSLDQADKISLIEDNAPGIDFVLEKAPSDGITGRVRDGAGSGIRDIEVNVFSEKLASGTSAVTGQNGEYAVTGLVPGDDYIIYVWSQAYNVEFYYAVPKTEQVGEYIPDYSVLSEAEATLVSPGDPPVPNIDIIINIDQGGSIEGHVYTSENEPVTGIEVSAWSDSLISGNTGLTDETGYYIIKGLEKVSSDDADIRGYIVEISSPGYSYQAYNMADKEEDAARIPTGSSGIDFYLKTSGSISGNVTNAGATPVPGTVVTARSLSDPVNKQGTAVSDESGDYHITGIPIADDYIVGAFPVDYQVQYYNLKTDQESADMVDITRGNRDETDFVLDKGGVIKGFVYLEDTVAPSGVIVNIWSDSDRTGGDVQTDENGRYEISGLNKDVTDYVVSARHPGHVSGFYSHEATVYAWDAAARVAPSESLDRNIVLITGFSVKGRVTFNGEPVPGIRVEAESESGWGSAVTDENSEFNYSIAGLMPGTYEISVLSENYTDQTKTVIIENQDISVDFDLAEVPKRSISGTITGLESGKTVKITVWSLTGDFSRSILLKGTGAPLDYSISDLKPANDYIAELVSDDYPYQAFNSRNSFEDADMVDISESDAPGIDFVLTSDLTVISGSIIFPGDADPGDTARIDIFSRSAGAERGIQVIVTDSQIVTYSLRGLVKAGDYIAYVSSGKYLDHYYDGTDQGAFKEEDAIYLDTAANSEIVADFRLSAGTRISGKVYNKDGQGIAGLQVEAWSSESSLSGFAYTLENGTYVIEGLSPAGDYIVKAWDKELGSFFYGREGTVMSESFATPVSTLEGKPENIDIRLIDYETISGTVTDLEGEPLFMMWVEAHSEQMQAGNGVFTDEDGNYVIKGLPSSMDYTVSARPDWYTLPIEKLNVSSGSTGINFSLNPNQGYELEGTVTDSKGNPIPDVRVEAWSESLNIPGQIWSVTDRSGKFMLDGVPQADDYVIKVWPPEGLQFAFFIKKGVSVPMEAETMDIELPVSMKFSGKLSAKDGSPLADIRVSAISSGTGFQGRTLTAKDGSYEIPNVPDGTDYVIAAESSGKNYLGKRKTGRSPGDPVDFILEADNPISGKVEVPVSGKGSLGKRPRVEISSESRQGMPGFSGSAITDDKGNFTVKGLRAEDDNGYPVNDYVATVISEDYPSESRIITAGSLTPLNFKLSRGPENEISGSIMGYDGELVEGLDFFADSFDEDGRFYMSVRADIAGNFNFRTLNSEKKYYLKFTAHMGDEEMLVMWAGDPEEDYFPGVVNPSDPDEIPADAKAFSTNTAIHFRFSIPIPVSGRAGERLGVPNIPFGNQCSQTACLALRTASRSSESVTIESTTHTAGMTSGSPFITVTWESGDESSIEGYYYEFNQVSDYRISKHNVPPMLPVMINQVTSGELSGDNVPYYFHVAPVDNRGKILHTWTYEFRIDTVPPSNGTVTCPDATSNRMITLTLGAMDAREMYISNIGYGQGGKWETRVKTRQWEITEGDGVKKIYVQLRDDAGNTANYLVSTEMLSDLNYIPEIEDQVFSVDENSPDGTSLGMVAASDDDPDDALAFIIKAGNIGEAFAIDADTGEITVSSAGQLDYETTPVYTLTVEVSDGSDASEAAVTITVRDLSEYSPKMEDQAFSVDENSANGTIAGKVAASDDDPDDILEFAIAGGNTGDVFAIDSATGQITVKNSAGLDYETSPVFTLAISVSDGVNTVSASVTININDVDEVELVIKDQFFTVDENLPAGSPVGTVAASGPGTLAYRITAGNTGNIFAIDSSTGEITVNEGGQPDYETSANYVLTVEVSDEKSAESALITITVNDLSEYAPEVQDASFFVDENSSMGTIVGTVQASDADPKDTLGYTIIQGNTGDAFAIDKDSGQITVLTGTQLDFETAPVFTLTVEVSDGTETATALITVNLNDVAEDVLTVKDQSFAIDENSPAGTPVGKIVASGSSGTPAFAITAGNTGDVFDISDGEITVSKQPDFETAQSYTLTLTVSDSVTEVTALITITVNDLSEYSPVAEDAEFSVDENSPAGTVAGTVTASDEDVKDTLSYRITGGNTDDAFAIDSKTGVITVNDSKKLDYETTPVFSLSVQVSDSVNTATATITINIRDLPEEVLVAEDQSFQVDENSPGGTVVGTVAASGPTDILDYSVTSGNTGNVFSLNASTGEIKVADSSGPDYESASEYVLGVQVSDGVTLVSVTITININDLSEYMPMAEDQTFQVDENSPGETVVGTVEASDDDPADILSFRITAGNTGNAFSIDSETGQIMVNDSAVLDYETTPEFLLNVAVSDGINTVTVTITVILNDLAEDELVVEDQTFTVDENSPDGTVAGRVAASGPVTDFSFRILSGNTGDVFDINDTTGEIKVRDSSGLDYETTPSYVLAIEVSDSISIVNAEITINVIPTGETHKPVVSDQTFFIEETAGVGTEAGTVTATDPDPGDVLAFEITAGNTGNAFAIDSKTGAVTINQELDYDTTPVYILTVEVSDGTNVATAKITVNVSKEIPPFELDLTWQNPIPTGNPINSIWGTGDLIFMAGSAGTIIRYDGMGRTAMTVPTESSLYGIWGYSESDVFAVGDDGVILHYDGENWTVMNSGTSERLRAVWGRPGNVFAVGDKGVILVYDNSEWTVADRVTDSSLLGIWGNSESVFAVGENGVVLCYNGQVWNIMETGTGKRLLGIWGFSESAVFAVGDGGIILRYDGAGWKEMQSSTTENLKNIYGFSESDIFAVGEYGAISHYDGTSWSRMESGTTEWLYDVWGKFGADVFATGHSGTILHYNGAGWSPASMGSRAWLKGIWGASESDIFAVGGNLDYNTYKRSGAVLHYDGTGWEEMDVSASDYFYDVWGVSGSDVFAVGGNGIIFRYDGTAWNKMTGNATEKLSSIWGVSGYEVFVAGDFGLILHYDGAGWHVMETGVAENLRSIWGVSGTEVFAVGDNGTILHYDGVGWILTESGISEHLESVWGISGSDVFAAGDAGTVLHYNGTEWKSFNDRLDGQLKDMWGFSGRDVFAVGDDGLVLHYNGLEWKKTGRVTHNNLKAVWGFSDSVFMVGDTGTILRTVPK